jgi:hypothetical protein
MAVKKSISRPTAKPTSTGKSPRPTGVVSKKSK